MTAECVVVLDDGVDVVVVVVVAGLLVLGADVEPETAVDGSVFAEAAVHAVAAVATSSSALAPSTDPRILSLVTKTPLCRTLWFASTANDARTRERL